MAGVISPFGVTSGATPHTLLPGWASAVNEVIPFQNNTTNITGVLGCNFRKLFQFLGTGQYIGSVRLVFANFYDQDLPGLNPITIGARLEDTGGSTPWTALTFGGDYNTTISPGGIAVTDPVAVTLQAVTTGAGTFTGYGFAVRMFVGVTSTSMTIPTNYYTATYGDSIDTTQTDVTTTSAFTPNTPFWGYGPIAILSGNPVSQLVAFIGDSITSGLDDFPQYQGYTTRWGMRDATLFVKLSQYGETAYQFAQPQNSALRRAFADSATVAICAHGVNDGNSGYTVAQCQSNLQVIWKDLKGRGVKRVYQATITPRSSSTNGWATLGNQTNTGWTPAQLAQLNGWIRNVPPPLSGYIEIGNVVSSSQDSGLWNSPGWTTDGVHPTVAAHEAILATLRSLASM